MRIPVTVGFCKPVIRSIQMTKDSICEGDCVHFSATVDNYPQDILLVAGRGKSGYLQRTCSWYGMLWNGGCVSGGIDGEE